MNKNNKNNETKDIEIKSKTKGTKIKRKQNIKRTEAKNIKDKKEETQKRNTKQKAKKPIQIENDKPRKTCKRPKQKSRDI